MGAQAHVVGDDQLRLLQDVREGGAERTGDLGRELLAGDAADVVRLDDGGEVVGRLSHRCS